MALIEARQFTTGADMIAAARNVRNRLWKPHAVNLAQVRKRFVDVEFVDVKVSGIDYNGMNPEFVRQAQAKARIQNAINEAEWRKNKAILAKEQKEKKRIAALAQVEMFERQALAAEEKRKANSEVAIAAYKSWEWGRKPTLKRQIMILSDLHGVEYTAIVGPSRINSIMEYRMKFIKQIAEDNPEKSMVEIGRAFGDRDHTTIRSALLKVGCPSRGYPEKGAA